MIFKENEKIVLVGDSITQDGRFDDPEGIGKGYVRLVHDYIRDHSAELNLEIINKGISADRVTDLADRWQEDVIAEQPDWVSVSIGINDVWRQLDSPEKEQVSPEAFLTIYRKLLTDLKAETGAHLILMEPTVIEEDKDSKGNQMLQPYIAAIHELVKEFDATVVSTHQTFINFLEKTPSISLTTDGVHLNDLGRKLMATTWLVSTGMMSQ